jgi:hypothetical protein
MEKWTGMPGRSEGRRYVKDGLIFREGNEYIGSSHFHKSEFGYL